MNKFASYRVVVDSSSLTMISETKNVSKMAIERDEKLEGPSESSLQPSDVERLIEEKRLVRKLDSRILPITCLLYLFACQHNC